MKSLTLLGTQRILTPWMTPVVPYLPVLLVVPSPCTPCRGLACPSLPIRQPSTQWVLHKYPDGKQEVVEGGEGQTRIPNAREADWSAEKVRYKQIPSAPSANACAPIVLVLVTLVALS